MEDLHKESDSGGKLVSSKSSFIDWSVYTANAWKQWILEGFLEDDSWPSLPMGNSKQQTTQRPSACRGCCKVNPHSRQSSLHSGQSSPTPTKAKAAPNQVEPYVHLSSDDDNCSCILIPFLSPSSLRKLLQVKMQRLQRRRMPEKLPSRRTSMRRRRTRMRRRISIMRRRRTRMRRRLIPTIRRVRMEVHLHQDLRIRSRLRVRNQAPSQG